MKLAKSITKIIDFFVFVVFIALLWSSVDRLLWLKITLTVLFFMDGVLLYTEGLLTENLEREKN